MHIHILGICGTFMGGIALLARAMGHTVTGSDANVYPPMSTQLQEQGITLMEGYEPSHLQSNPDCVVIGNALSRGNPAVEYVLNNNLPYTSGAQWLSEHILQDRWVLAVAGTHGKTTTSSILAWILEANNLSPGFLIGGIPANFNLSARAGETPFFVVEADEYDTAFFDKRSKFVHYHPRTLILNNLEYDHADIFPDLAAIQTQFHHLIRTVPGNGLIISADADQNLDEVLKQGCWTPTELFDVSSKQGWSVENASDDGSEFDVYWQDNKEGHVKWDLVGVHNMNNALAAIAAARHVGVPPELACECLGNFQGIRRRMELRGEVNHIRVYDDFAHHPTAIATTLDGLRKQVGDAPILAVLEPRSNTMRMGIHAEQLAPSLSQADEVFISSKDLDWDINIVVNALKGKAQVFNNTQSIIDAVISKAQPGSSILVMSNGGFDNIHQRLLDSLAS
ncbi:MAG: UDP-N-acetylmuramate:L-alanyl-gamma-D-glutamyl-meso-diaminopimelate ligase [Gammaproteobacteria bacterium]